MLFFGLEDINGNARVNCYPNPFNSQTTFEVNIEFINSELKVYNLMGKEVKRQTIISPETIFIRGGLSAGIYFYELVNSKGSRVSGKFMIY